MGIDRLSSECLRACLGDMGFVSARPRQIPVWKSNRENGPVTNRQVWKSNRENGPATDRAEERHDAYNGTLRRCAGRADVAYNWTRTSDLFLTKEVLYRLSYVGAVGM